MTVEHHLFIEGFERGEREGRKYERAIIVAWLRARSQRCELVAASETLLLMAERIEKGEHAP